MQIEWVESLHRCEGSAEYSFKIPLELRWAAGQRLISVQICASPPVNAPPGSSQLFLLIVARIFFPPPSLADRFSQSKLILVFPIHRFELRERPSSTSDNRVREGQCRMGSGSWRVTEQAMHEDGSDRRSIASQISSEQSSIMAPRVSAIAFILATVALGLSTRIVWVQMSVLFAGPPFTMTMSPTPMW